MDLEYALDRIRSLAVARFDPKVVAALESAVKDGRLRLSATLVEV
jgi:HD-GYP domain-containing protein (c-di-GMP phosphodiesterase class II)